MLREKGIPDKTRAQSGARGPQGENGVQRGTSVVEEVRIRSEFVEAAKLIK